MSTKLQAAAQTLPWISTRRGIRRVLHEIRSAGYQGVEFAHAPKDLGTPSELLKLLQQENLILLGLAGGSLKERIDYAKEFQAGAKPDWQPYVYVDDWEGAICCEAMRDGVRLAVHPHMFRSIQTAADAEKLLEQHSALEFLPDTAHLMIAGEILIEVLAKSLKKYKPRFAAIHLKDWTPEFGRAYQFYSQGFLPLGKGDVPLDDVLGILKIHRFDGWFVIEQDASVEPADTARESLNWLNRKWYVGTGRKQQEDRTSAS